MPKKKPEPPKVTQAQVFEIVQRNIQCIARNCPLLIFAEPISREINAIIEEECRGYVRRSDRVEARG